MAPVLERLRREARFPAGEVAECLGMTREAYLEAEKDANALPLDRLERLSALYHVEEHDILTGTARSRAVTRSVRQEEELMPFFRIVRSYMKMTRLLEEAKNGQRP